MPPFTVAALAAAIGPELRRLRCFLARLRGRQGVGCLDDARPEGRRIELVASDVRRLGGRFRNVPPGVSFARFEALRQAYDGVLAEACKALEVDHLLQVLPPGPELDRERRRVEVALYRAGLSLDDDW